MVQVPNAAPSSGAATQMRASSTNGSTNNAPTTVYVNGNTFHPMPTPPVHLSAMSSMGLDMSGVERRGQPTTSRIPPKQERPHGLQDAPTYYPTEEEFKDPMEYMKKISPEASQYGICKIVPPDSWNPPFAIDTERFHFKTRKQELNSVEGSTRANLTYLDQLAKFHKQHGTKLNRFPSVDKQPLDLYKLKKTVENHGGFEEVCKGKKWARIGRDLGYSGKIMSSLSTSLKKSYQRWLFPYEEYLRFAKPGVHQQLEYEYGGPLTPSPAYSPAKNMPLSVSSPSRDSPAVRASEAFNAQIKDAPIAKSGDGSHPPPTATTSSSVEPPRTGFTPVNAGGFTPVNTSSTGFVPVTASNRREREKERDFTPSRRPLDSPLPSTSTPTLSEKPIPNKPAAEHRTPLPNGQTSTTNGTTTNPLLKRQLSTDSPDPKEEENSAEDGNERRSKRLKKEAVPTVAGSNMTMFRPAAPKVPGEDIDRCEQCGKTDDLPKIIFCESCDNGYHMYCLDNPMVTKPGYDWYCPRCLVGDGQFGFEEGSIYSLRQFQQKAAEFKENYFQDKLPIDPILNCPRPITEDDIEREFWRLVANLEETVEVEYGADIHSTTHGSGFPTVEKEPKNPYSTDPWNLTILPLYNESLFRHIKTDISGMTQPWNYVGMIFSTFCWHNEDHYAYSANYQHFGATKTWYGIPGADAEAFEAAMREAVPELFETQPDLLFQLVTLLTPEQLKKAGVRVYALDQRAGQYVITFPQAYHAGFNHGFNFNEAVNFAPADWEPFGDAGVERLQQFRKQPCFSHDELLWTAAEAPTGSGVTIQTAKWLTTALDRVRKREFEQRKAFITKHEAHHADVSCSLTDDATVTQSDKKCDITFDLDPPDKEMTEDEYQCVYCKAYAYLSRFKCDTTGKVMCLLHAGEHQCCEMTEEQRFAGNKHTLHYRRTNDAIDSLCQKIEEKSQLPEHWQEKYNRILEETATPSLKTLRSLLSEGERIPWDLPSLPQLKSFVERCNDWVEEATNFIVRKQQNRRKSEKNIRKSSRTAEMEEKDRELRKVENITKLLKDSDQLGFECPEITQLQERADAIAVFRADAQKAISNQRDYNTKQFEDLLEEGKAFNVDMPELQTMDILVQQLKWVDRALEAQSQRLSLDAVRKLIKKSEEVNIPQHSAELRYLKGQQEAGLAWEAKAKELMSAESVHYPQLEALSQQAQQAALPVSKETLAAVDQILNKQREAHRQILSLVERSKDPDISRRPKYAEVRETLEGHAALTSSRPNGTLELEKEQKRHEDWMRKGKKLFGKANAPLHILKSHMEYVLSHNLDCFNIADDKPRQPAEPASREASPTDEKMHSWDGERSREVFCICRKVEAGMMIECELCHEWYHGKCLKIARGKVKEDEKYTCPICDWRVKIPRDAARPKLEDLQAWQDEIQLLPFQPDEEDILSDIIDNAVEFKNHVAPYCNPTMPGTMEEAIIQRFFLRKIEGAEILLAFETNFFRQELHKWQPVANEPPPLLESSKSTRKPRPTKMQKLMAQHGVADPEQLPQALRTKSHSFKRKSSEPSSLIRPQPLQPAPGRLDSSTPTLTTSAGLHGPSNSISNGVGHGQTSAFSSRYPYSTSGAADVSMIDPGLQQYTPPPYMDRLGFGQTSSHTDRDPSIFTPAGMIRIDPALSGSLSGSLGGTNMGSPLRSFVPAPVSDLFGLPGGMTSNEDRLFSDLTHHDDDGKTLGRSFTEQTLEGLREKDMIGDKGDEESEFMKQVGYESAYGNAHDDGRDDD